MQAPSPSAALTRSPGQAWWTSVFVSSVSPRPTSGESTISGWSAPFRRSRAEQSDIGAISAWLRLGEREAEKLDTRTYDRAGFLAALGEIRELTVEPPEVFEPRIHALLHRVGVGFVLVPAIPRSHVSGVARWLRPRYPLIQLSLYGKTNDRFWFTFFHEAAHILLHAADKKSVWLDDPNSKPSTRSGGGRSKCLGSRLARPATVCNRACRVVHEGSGESVCAPNRHPPGHRGRLAPARRVDPVQADERPQGQLPIHRRLGCMNIASCRTPQPVRVWRVVAFPGRFEPPANRRRAGTKECGGS